MRVVGESPHLREVGIILGNPCNKRKCEGEDETEREKEKPDNRCKKNLHTSQNKSCYPKSGVRDWLTPKMRRCGICIHKQKWVARGEKVERIERNN